MTKSSTFAPAADAPDAGQVEIEIFRAGPVRDARGTDRHYSRAELQQLADDYNAASAAEQAPLVIGHPKDNAPAYGWIARLALKGDTLTATVRDIAQPVIDAVRARHFSKVSSSLWPADHPSNPRSGQTWLRHVGLLGGAAPAVPGLAALSFAAPDDIITLEFNSQEAAMADVQTPDAAAAAQRQADLDAREAALSKREAEFTAARDSFAKDRAAARRADTAAFVEAQVAAGRVAPAIREELTEFMVALDDEAAIEFSAASKQSASAWFRTLLASARPVIDFSAAAPDGARDADAGEDGSRALSQQALEYQAEQAAKGIAIDIAAAVRFVKTRAG